MKLCQYHKLNNTPTEKVFGNNIADLHFKANDTK